MCLITREYGIHWPHINDNSRSRTKVYIMHVAEHGLKLL